MAWQDIYATMKDDCSNKVSTSSSRRGTVSEIWVDCDNAINKESVRVTFSTSGPVNYSVVSNAKDRLRYFESKGNKKKIVEWKHRLNQAQQEYDQNKENEYVNCDVSFPINIKGMNLKVNDCEFSQELYTMLYYAHNKKFEQLLEHISKKYNNGKDIIEQVLANKI